MLNIDENGHYACVVHVNCR